MKIYNFENSFKIVIFFSIRQQTINTFNCASKLPYAQERCYQNVTSIILDFVCRSFNWQPTFMAQWFSSPTKGDKIHTGFVSFQTEKQLLIEIVSRVYFPIRKRLLFGEKKFFSLFLSFSLLFDFFDYAAAITFPQNELSRRRRRRRRRRFQWNKRKRGND